jgi:hypothetical protein
LISIYALLLISQAGGIEELYRFQNLDDCQQAKQMIDAKTMCVAINVRKPSEEMKDFFNQFNETVKQFKKNNDNKETL